MTAAETSDTNAQSEPLGAARWLAVAGLFILSGASALVYEVVWSRQLTTLFGATQYAVATVLTAFMGGLALGSFLIGRYADRLRRPLLFYGLLEAGIGFAALAFPTALDLCEPIVGKFYATGGEETFFVFSLLRFAIAFVLLMVPTTLMGATLPVMSRAVTRDARIGRSVGALYALNTAGAVLGVFVTGFFLLERFGVWHTTLIAVGLDVLVAVVSILVGLGLEVASSTKTAAAKREPLPRGAKLVLVTYFASGLVALACQVAWTRSLLFGFESLKATTYSFTGMLTVFLLGLAIGSAAMQAVVDRLRNPVAVYAAIQFLIGATVCLSVYMIRADLPIVFREFDLKTSGNLFYWNAIGNVMLRTAAAIGVPTLLMGMAFPIVARVVVSSRSSLGADIGRLYAINTLGAIAGSFLGGFVLIPAVGITVAIGSLAAISFASCIALVLSSTDFPASRRALAAGLLATAAALFVGRIVVGGGARFFHPLTIGEKMAYYNEGPLATVSVIEDSRGWRTIYVDAIGVAGTDPVLQTDQKTLAHVPMMLLGGEAESVLTVGFGAGGASWSYTLYPAIRNIHAIEITTNVPKAAPALTDANHGIVYTEEQIGEFAKTASPDVPPPGGVHPLSMYTVEPAPNFRTFDQRYRLIVDDARSYLRFADTTYDVIATDCTDLRYKSNANLYDLEYFNLCKERISDRGLVVVWMPLAGMSDEAFRIVVRTFAQVFPEMTVWYFANQPTHYCLFIGQKDGLKIDYEAVKRAVEIPAIRRDLDEIGLRDPAKLVASFVTDERGLRSYVGDGPLNTEDFPVIEFLSPRYGYDAKPIAENMGRLYDVQVPVEDLVVDRAHLDPADRERMARFQQANAVLFDGHVLYREFKFDEASKRYQQAKAIAPDDESIDRLLEFEELTRRLELDLTLGESISPELWLNGQWLAFSVSNVFANQERYEKAVSIAAPFARRLPPPTAGMEATLAENGHALNGVLARCYRATGNEKRAGEFDKLAAEYKAAGPQ